MSEAQFNTKDLQLLKKQALQGIAALAVRRITTQLAQTVGSVILARILFPADFGAFALIFLLINIFSLVSDVGLAAAVIQRDKKPTKEELRSIFTGQVLLGILAALLVILTTPIFFHLFREQLKTVSINLFWLSAFAPLLYNLRLISHSLLARSIRVPRLVVGEIVETLSLQIITVWLALSGLGVASFVWGVIASRALSAFIFFFLQPWRIGVNFSIKNLKSFLPFGFPYQVNTVIGTVNGATAPIVIGGLVGTTALGLVNWAAGVGALPRALGEIVGWMLFPVGARIQRDRRSFRHTIERALEVTSMVTFPMVAIMMALAPPITYIVFTGRWEAGIPALYIFTLQSALMVFSSVFTNALLALGEARVVRNINLFWVVLQWLLTIPLVNFFGFIGYAWASLLASYTLFMLLLELKKYVSITLTPQAIPYLLYSTVTGIATYAYTLLFPIKGIASLVFAIFLGLSVYGFLLFSLRRRVIFSHVAEILHLLMRK